MPDQTIITRLPAVRGRYTENAPLGAQGWFKCGGIADVLFRPADTDDLIHFLKNTPTDIPVSVFGVLSNTIIRDGGVRGVVVKLGREFAGIDISPHPNPLPVNGEREQTDLPSPIPLTLGAAALDTNVAMFAADHGLTGLEFLGGIPGTIGGAIKMNAGAIGAGTGDTFGQTSMRDVLVAATAIDRAGNVHIVTPDQLNMSYRHTDAPEDWIFVACTVHATRDPGGVNAVTARMAALKERREAAQPTREKTGGSTFANPTPDELAAAGVTPGMRVWQLIDGVGGRGLKIGGAYMSEKHCNFMINDSTATAADLENLGDEIRRRVQDQFGVTLRWEIKRVGDML